MVSDIQVLKELKSQGDKIPETLPLSGWVQSKTLADSLRQGVDFQASATSVAGKLRYLRTLGFVEYNYFYPHGGYWRITPGGKKRLKNGE